MSDGVSIVNTNPARRVVNLETQEGVRRNIVGGGWKESKLMAGHLVQHHTFKAQSLLETVHVAGCQARPSIVSWRKWETVGRIKGQRSRGRFEHSIFKIYSRICPFNMYGSICLFKIYSRLCPFFEMRSVEGGSWAQYRI